MSTGHDGRSMGAADGFEDGAAMTFRDQVGLWLEVWTAGAPELRARAREAADPETDPWGYLIALGELLTDTTAT